MEKKHLTIIGECNLIWPKACWSTVMIQEQNNCYIKSWHQRQHNDADWLCFDIELGASVAKWTR